MKKEHKIGLCAAACVALVVGAFFYIKGKKADSANPAGQGGAPAGQNQMQGGPGGGKPNGGGKPGGGPGGGGGASQPSVTSVRTLVAADTSLQDYVNTTGEIEPVSSIDVFPDIGGKVRDVYVNLGEKVKKGQMLLKIDPSKPGMQYALSPVYSPIAGTITSLPAKSGATVAASSSVATIGDVENLKVTIRVSEKYVASLKNGLLADIVLEAYPENVFTATVVRVSPVLDPANRTKEVELKFTEKDSRVNAGMFAKVKLYTNVYSGYPVIPESAVLEKAGEHYVYVVNSNGSTVSPRSVTTGKSVDNMIQLTSGVSLGDKMVVEGMNALGDGSTIRDITDVSAN